MSANDTPASVMDEKKQLRASRKTFLIVLAMFTVPIVIVALLYAISWRPSKSGNYGELIQPPYQLAEVPLVGTAGKSVKMSDLQGKWILLYLGSGTCGTSCLKNLYYMRQIHTGFAKELERIQEVMITLDGAADGGLGEKLKEYPRTKVLTGTPDALANLKAQFKISASAKGTPTGQIYIIDPRGFVMMRYPAEPDPAGIRRDIERLLKYSWVG